MREHHKLICAFFQEHMSATRKDLGISQQEMAARLDMSPRSYADLERGKSCPLTHSLLLYLAMLPEHKRNTLIEEYYSLAKEVEGHETLHPAV